MFSNPFQSFGFLNYLLDLFDTFELDKEHNWIDLILMKSFHRTDMNIQNAVLILNNISID